MHFATTLLIIVLFAIYSTSGQEPAQEGWTAPPLTTHRFEKHWMFKALKFAGYTIPGPTPPTQDPGRVCIVNRNCDQGHKCVVEYKKISLWGHCKPVNPEQKIAPKPVNLERKIDQNQPVNLEKKIDQNKKE